METPGKKEPQQGTVSIILNNRLVCVALSLIMYVAEINPQRVRAGGMACVRRQAEQVMESKAVSSVPS